VRRPEDEVDRQRVRVVGGVLRRLNAVVGDEEVEGVAEGCRERGWGSIELVEHPLMERGRGEEELGELLECRKGVQVIYSTGAREEGAVEQIIREVMRTKSRGLMECEEIWVKA